MRRAFHHLRDYREGATAALHGARISRHIAHEGAEDANGFLPARNTKGEGERRSVRERKTKKIIVSLPPRFSSISRNITPVRRGRRQTRLRKSNLKTTRNEKEPKQITKT